MSAVVSDSIPLNIPATSVTIGVVLSDALMDVYGFSIGGSLSILSIYSTESYCHVLDES